MFEALASAGGEGVALLCDAGLPIEADTKSDAEMPLVRTRELPAPCGSGKAPAGLNLRRLSSDAVLSRPDCSPLVPPEAVEALAASDCMGCTALREGVGEEEEEEEARGRAAAAGAGSGLCERARRFARSSCTAAELSALCSAICQRCAEDCRELSRREILEF